MTTKTIDTENNVLIPEKNKKGTVKWLFILSVLLIYPLPQIAIDVYLPSLPTMVHALHTSQVLLQLSLTIYVLFLGIAQLIYGPLSDKFGRKPILLIGISIFFLSSFVSMFINSINQLLVLRAIQGLGIGCGFTIASAILADVFEGNHLAKITSYSAMVYSLSLIFAPAIGGYLQHYIDWQANFAIMTIYALVLFILIYFFVFETRKSKNIKVSSLNSIIKNYLFLFSSLTFIGGVFCLILVYGVIITFNVIGPFLLQETLHVSVINYGKLLLIVGFSYFLGATINSYFVKQTGIHALIILGLILMNISGLGLLILGMMGWMNVTNIIIFVSLAILSLGFIYPNCFAYVLDIFPEKGYASAFIGSAILIGVSVISAIVSHYKVNYEFFLSVTFLILSILSILTYLFTKAISKKAI